jgi:hypothetical protein
MPYHIGEKGSYGCSGFPALKDGTNEVMGCHATKAEAAAQIYAINRSEGNIGKAATSLVEGDFAMTEHGGEGDFHIGQVVHVMYEGMLGNTGTEYALQATPENPAVLIQLFEQEEDGTWEATRLYSACSMGLMVKIPPLKTEESEEMDSETMMAMYDSSIGKREMANAPYEDAQLDREDSAEIEMAAKPNYGDMIKPRRGGSTPANPRLYAAVVQAAKDKFDVYPSAVANGWVVQEYKRRGGTYKGVDMDKREFSGSQRERMAGAGTAMPDGSFPIASRADLMNAIRSVGRAKDYGAARAHIIRRARALNAMDMLPEDWRNKATKGIGEWSGSIFDLNPFVK